MINLFRLYQWALWNLFSRPFFVELFLKRRFSFGLTEQSGRYPRPPFILVANHGTFFDPWIIGSYSVTPFGFMTNDDGFRDGIITRWYLKSIGAFPKKKGANDYRAMKITLNLLKRKTPVCIFPEGQTTWDGETQLLNRGIEKLIKRAACPLVAVRLQGNFLMKPWWAATARTGKIRVTISVYEPEQLKKMSDNEIFSLIRESIHQNDIKDPGNASVPFAGHRLAEGLERFVWICLGCGAEDTLTTGGDTVSCSACGHVVTIDAHCRLFGADKHPASCSDLWEWAELHRQRVKEKIARREVPLTTSSNVVLQRENEKRQFADVDTGTLTLTPEKISFSGQHETVTLSLDEIDDVVIQKRDLFEFRHGSEYLRFFFTKKSPMKWVYYLRYCKGFERCEAQGHL